MQINLLGLYSRQKHISCTLEHGRKYEGTALKAYSEKTGSNVTASDLVICLTKPYLACSPDGIVDACTSIEIKCSYVARDKSVTPLTVPYLELAPNGKLCLKHDHDYMYQVQGNMHITRKTLCHLVICHLVIFTLVDLVIVEQRICIWRAKQLRFILPWTLPEGVSGQECLPKIVNHLWETFQCAGHLI